MHLVVRNFLLYSRIGVFHGNYVEFVVINVHRVNVLVLHWYAVYWCNWCCGVVDWCGFGGNGV